MKNFDGKRDIDEEKINQMVKDLFLGAAPEKIDFIENLWEEHSPQIIEAYDKERFLMMASEEGRIHFTYRTILIVWLLGYSAWKSFEAFADYIYVNKFSKKPLSLEDVNKNIVIHHHIEAMKKINDEVQSILNTPKLKFYNWPEGIPFPEPRKNLFFSKDKVISDLSILAGARLFFHEFHHTMQDGDYQLKNESIKERVEKEGDCDEFADKMMLDTIDEYAEENDIEKRKVIKKRGMAIILSWYIHFQLQDTDSWNQQGDHPPLTERTRNSVSKIKLPKNHDIWIFAASLLLGQLYESDQFPENLQYQNFRSLTEDLIDVIKN